MINGKAWLFAIFLGLIGIAISSAIFFGIMVFTGTVFGFVAILTGAIAGGAAAFGFKIGNARFETKNDVSIFLWICTAFGFLAIISSLTLAPYLYIAPEMDFLSFLNFYSKIGGLSPIDILFVLIGAYGGHWAAQKIGYSIAVKYAQSKETEEKKAGMTAIDKKFG